MEASSENGKTPARGTDYFVFYNAEKRDTGWTRHPQKITANGTEAAKRKAALIDVIARAAADGGIEIACVPARSWSPSTVKLVPQDPIIKVG